MHEVNGWPADVTVAEPQARVIVGGRERKVVDYSVTQSMGDTLSGGSGLIAATADVTIADQSETVTQRRVTPWSPLAVRRGEPVTIEAGYKAALAPQLVGVVDGTSGGATKDTRLEIVDRYAALQQEVTLEPLLATMPPFDDGQPFLHVGLTPTYVTSRLLRECGFYATPPHRFGATVNVPMNGSMLPEYGSTYRCSRIGDATEVPEFERAPWGQAVKNVTATYRPASFDHSGRPFEMQMLVGEAGSSGTAVVSAHWGSQHVRVTVGSGRNVSFDVNTGAGNVTVVSLSGAQMAGASMVSARVSGSTWSLTTDTGIVMSASRSWPWSAMFTEARIVVPAAATQIGGVQVGYLQTAIPDFTPTARLTPAAFAHTLRAMPAIVRRRVADLLKEQAEAELAAFWINDQGVLVWKNRFELVAGPPVKEITSTKHLLDLKWREPSATTTRSIKVAGQRPIVSVSQRATITVYQGGKKTLDSGQEYSEFYKPATDEDWIMPNTNLNWLTASAPDIGGFHHGRRSWVGMVVTSQNPTPGEDPHEEWVSRSDQPLTKIDPQTLVWTTTAPVVASNESIELRSRETDPVIFPQWRNTDLPIVRAYGRTQWVDQAELRAGEPNGLQEHSHEVGWWVQHTVGLAGVADALEQRLLNPSPILDDVPIVPDARLELGDIVTLIDEHVTGLNLRCLIEGITLSGAEGEQDQTLTLRILAVNGREATYEELEHAWSDAAYTGLENEWSGEHYSHFENNPTRRG